MMATKIEFKNIGNIDRATRKKELENPIGIKTPIRRDARFGLFGMNTNILEQIKDNFKNLLLTNHNERVINNKFGANLRALLFEQSVLDQDTIERIAEHIKEATAENMPYIQLLTMEIATSNTDKNVPDNFANVRIEFSVDGLTRENDVSELSLFLKT